MLSVSKPCLHLFIITILRYTIYVNNHQPSFQVHADVELFWYIMAEPQTYLRKGTMDMLLSGLIFLPPGVIGWYFLILSNYEEIIEKTIITYLVIRVFHLCLQTGNQILCERNKTTKEIWCWIYQNISSSPPSHTALYYTPQWTLLLWS